MFEGNVQRGRSLGFEGGMFRMEERVAVGMLPRAIVNWVAGVGLVVRGGPCCSAYRVPGWLRLDRSKGPGDYSFVGIKR